MDELFELDDQPSLSPLSLPLTAPHSFKELPQLLCTASQVKELPQLLKDGFTRSGLLLCSLECTDPFPDWFTGHVTSLFGHMTVTCQALYRNITSLFYCFRKHLFIICSSPMATDQHFTSFSYCTNFLHFLNSKINHYCQTTPFVNNSPTLFDDVITHLTNTIQALESHDIIRTDNDNNYSKHILLHICWTKISILHQLLATIGGKYISLYIEYCIELIQLLLNEALVTFNKITTFKHSVPCLFSCPCFLEIWLLVAKTTDTVSNDNNTPTFWELLEKVLSTISVDIYYSWWVVSQITTLYGYSNEGEWVIGFITSGLWKMVQELLTKCFKEPEEMKLRYSLTCCIYIYQHWYPYSVSPVVLCWEYFHKHLNNSFLLSNFEVREFMIHQGSCSQWVDLIKRSCDCHMTSSTCIAQGTSYEIFLKLLANCLTDGHHNDNQLWKQLKSRFYSKFSQKLVTELTSEGLTNLICLFLVLSYVCDTNEVGQQLYFVLNYRKLSSINESNLPLIWKGLFSLLMIYHFKKISFSNSLVKKLTTHIQMLTKAIVQSDAEIIHVTMATILKGAQELVDQQCIEVQCIIGSFLNDVIITSSGQLLSNALQCVHGISLSIGDQLEQLSRVSMETNENHVLIQGLKDILKLIWDQTSSAIITKCHGSIPTHLIKTISETAATLTCTINKWLSSISCNVLIEGLGLSENISSNLVVEYLVHVLNESLSTDLLSSEDMQLKICHSWLRCTVFSSTQMQTQQNITFTNLIYQLSYIKSLVNSGGSDTFSDPVQFLHYLLKGVGHHYNSSTNVDERILWKRKLSVILGDVYQYIEHILLNNTSLNKLRICYKVSSVIMRHCSKLIYSKNDSKCLLPQLLDALILPVWSSRRPAPQGMPQLIRGHLHHFLYGLFQMDFDEFLNRKLKQIFSKHFHSYLTDLQTSSTNPFLILIGPSFGKEPSPDSINIFKLTLDIIIKQELIIPQQSTSIIPTLQFIHQLLNRIQCYKLLLQATPISLISLLTCNVYYMQRSHDVCQLIDKILKQLLETCYAHQDELPCTELLHIVRSYIISSLSEYKELTLKPLVAIATYHPLLIKETVPIVRQCIDEYERKRGCGYDQLLRNSLSNLEDHTTN